MHGREFASCQFDDLQVLKANHCTVSCISLYQSVQYLKYSQSLQYLQSLKYTYTKYCINIVRDQHYNVKVWPHRILHSRLDFFREDLGAVSDEQGKDFIKISLKLERGTMVSGV